LKRTLVLRECRVRTFSALLIGYRGLKRWPESRTTTLRRSLVVFGHRETATIYLTTADPRSHYLMKAGYPQDQPAIQSLKVYMTERRRIVAQVRRGLPGTSGNKGGPGKSRETGNQTRRTRPRRATEKKSPDATIF